MQLTLEGKTQAQESIEFIKANEPPEGYYLAFSGGKDSVVLYDLALKARVQFDAHYCVSPIDPPQLRDFIKDYYPSVTWDFHARGWWKMVEKKGLPMRQARWCCQVIKEVGGYGKVVLLGNRAEEGTIRKHQQEIETASRRKVLFVRPMLRWLFGDIWEYIRDNQLPYCSLYDEGFHRLGCVLCPFSRDIERQIKYFPKVVMGWRRVCDRIVKNALESGRERKHNFQTGQELFDWWISRE